VGSDISRRGQRGSRRHMLNKHRRRDTPANARQTNQASRTNRDGKDMSPKTRHVLIITFEDRTPLQKYKLHILGIEGDGTGGAGPSPRVARHLTSFCESIRRAKGPLSHAPHALPRPPFKLKAIESRFRQRQPRKAQDASLIATEHGRVVRFIYVVNIYRPCLFHDSLAKICPNTRNHPAQA
jgi:hypothetical protein